MAARYLLSFLLALAHQGPAPFQKEIDAFHRQDQANGVPTGKILFIGSSSFTFWKGAQQAFPTHPLVNRAFGGSTLLDVTRYVDDVVTPYAPKQVVLYCGENDFAANPSLTPDQVFNRFKTLYSLIRTRTQNAPFVYVSMKPSPSRWRLAPKFKDANTLVQQFLAKESNTDYVDVWPVMLGDDRKPNPSIFRPDMLHMTAKGYALWTPLIEKVLK